jgi:hypothetical protein
VVEGRSGATASSPKGGDSDTNEQDEYEVAMKASMKKVAKALASVFGDAVDEAAGRQDGLIGAAGSAPPEALESSGGTESGIEARRKGSEGTEEATLTEAQDQQPRRVTHASASPPAVAVNFDAAAESNVEYDYVEPGLEYEEAVDDGDQEDVAEGNERQKDEL